MNLDKNEILLKLNEFKVRAEEMRMIVYAVALKGSQNYNLHDEDSDIDANLVFIPTLEQLRKQEKYKIEFDFGECTCHNIYAFADIVAKGNPQWVEVCQTEYVIGDLSLFRHYHLNPSALKGMMMEKVTAFSKLYPSRAKFVNEFGYDPKQLHHIIRLVDLLERGLDVYKYSDDERDVMLDIKRGRYPDTLEEAERMRDNYIERVNRIYEERKIEYKTQEVDYKMIDSIVVKELCKHYKG